MPDKRHQPIDWFAVEFAFGKDEVPAPDYPGWRRDTDGQQEVGFLTRHEAESHIATRRGLLLQEGSDVARSIHFRVVEIHDMFPVVTTHPKCYDYGYVRTLIPHFGEIDGKMARLIAIPGASLQYQMGRYGSDLTRVSMPLWQFGVWLRQGLCGACLKDGPTTSEAVNAAWCEDGMRDGLLPLCKECGDTILGPALGAKVEGTDIICDGCVDDRENGPGGSSERRQMGLGT